MVKSRVILIFILIVLFMSSAYGAVVINEVLANEPGSEVGLEWIELYNPSPTSANLAFYQLVVGNQSISLSGTITGYGYFIVCRRLFSESGKDGFETRWGNGSGVWGDTLTENYPQPFEASFSLTNSGDTIQLMLAGQEASEFAWISSGKDGYSWERFEFQESDIVQSVDYSGSTPGFINSRTPLPDDLSLDSVTVSKYQGKAQIGFTVTNIGINSQTGKQLLVFSYNEYMPDSIGRIITIIEVPLLQPGYYIYLECNLELDSIYEKIGGILDSDNRVRNNRIDFMAPGTDFPPVILSEFLADPVSPMTSEWIELYCPLTDSFVIQNWQYGDSGNLYQLSNNPVVVHSGEYLILAEDSIAFKQNYPLYQGNIIQSAQWATLNNNGDVIHLVDNYGIMVDTVLYSETYGDNYTWALDIKNGSNEWGRSVTIGGTPGMENDVILAPNDNRTMITIEPQIFSPDGDGFHEKAEIQIEAPAANAYTLKIYDREGRVVRTFADNEKLIRDRYEWNGLSDAGNRLPIGIYICYFEVVGVESIKKPVVIAR